MSLPTTKKGAARRALVVNESMYGNTHRIAEAIARGLRSAYVWSRLSRLVAHGMSMSVATT
jgi:flavorubredoxin